LREEIFRPFRSSKEYGTGIGLAFCRKVVESHGGTIGVVPRPGHGACFRIELPLSAAASDPPSVGIRT
jgi:two-component system sensor histidine kinase AtoS